MRRFLASQRVWIVTLLVVAALVAFEAAVRLLPPDAVSYSIQSSVQGGPVTRMSGTVTDPATVTRWRVAMTAQPSAHSLPDIYMRHWQGTDTCAGGDGYLFATYRFTWHGMPVEVVSSASTCLELFQVSSGGLPDWDTYRIEPLPQP